MNSLGTSNARIKISPAVISRTEMPVTVLDLAVKVFPFWNSTAGWNNRLLSNSKPDFCGK